MFIPSSLLIFLPFPSLLPSSPPSADGELYAGTSVDFMGANAAVFRTSVRGSSQHYIRTEAYDHNWLNGEGRDRKCARSDFLFVRSGSPWTLCVYVFVRARVRGLLLHPRHSQSRRRQGLPLLQGASRGGGPVGQEGLQPSGPSLQGTGAED